MADRPTVSVIVPCYNGENHVEEALRSVLAQTFCDFELIVVDDCSTDRSPEIVEGIASADSRVIFLRQARNQGVALARNRALELARGRFIAYLDSDDLWLPEKLDRQIAYMKAKGLGACFTSYETIEEDGAHRNVIHVPDEIDYRRFLTHTITCSHTVLFDGEIIDKDLLVMPDIRRGQDCATWRQVMKAGHNFYGLDECLAKYRKSSGSLSSDKVEAIQRTWYLYRKVEKLSVPYSIHCLFWQLIYATGKRKKD